MRFFLLIAFLLPAPLMAVDNLSDIQPMEEVMGRKLSPEEIKKIQESMAQKEDVIRKPQKPWQLGSVEIVFPLICGQLKMNLKKIFPQLSVEVQPCLDPITRKSYIMKGTAWGSGEILSAGIGIGVYVGPRHANQPVVGQYMFARASQEILPTANISGQLSYSKGCYDDFMSLHYQDCKFMGFVSGTWDAARLVTSFLSNVTPEGLSANSVDLGAVAWSYGMLVDVQEYPWWDRIRNGSSIKEAFHDVESYR